MLPGSAGLLTAEPRCNYGHEMNELYPYYYMTGLYERKASKSMHTTVFLVS